MPPGYSLSVRPFSLGFVSDSASGAARAGNVWKCKSITGAGTGRSEVPGPVRGAPAPSLSFRILLARASGFRRVPVPFTYFERCRAMPIHRVPTALVPTVSESGSMAATAFSFKGAFSDSGARGAPGLWLDLFRKGAHLSVLR
jgi:hypothetical protein